MQRCCSFLLLLLLVGGLSCCTFAAAVTHYKVTEDGTVAVAVEQRAAAAGSSSSSDAALVGQHLTVEIPGNRGLLRLLLGLTLLLGVYAYAAANVYPRLDSTYQRLVMKAEDFGDSVFGVEPKSKLQHMLER
ncbi:hypothetical protein, conserved [Eimeria tenella]|uniref:Uncharacterized protein n=1 Tax=Eimeria tenella TaxID=5802 RepID=U6KWW2_EIMTE|nr:hypothetical protein, conserved [Eimeria tenella]CDJ42637.1 hypothetical protein, conserved [Eimeria tenella]|eukprot:XP_013233387.1 hypothetical protein, conserved [Eimeria tenella]